MAKQKQPTKAQREAYVKFLQKRIDSKNYRNTVSADEYEKTKQKLAKEKLILKTI